jgi:hypothetical protein
MQLKLQLMYFSERNFCTCFKIPLPLSFIQYYMTTFTLTPLRPSGNYMNHLLWQSAMLYFVFIGFALFSLYTAIISLNSINELIVVIVKCCVLFEVWTEFLNVI